MANDAKISSYDIARKDMESSRTIAPEPIATLATKMTRAVILQNMAPEEDSTLPDESLSNLVTLTYFAKDTLNLKSRPRHCHLNQDTGFVTLVTDISDPPKFHYEYDPRERRITMGLKTPQGYSIECTITPDAAELTVTFDIPGGSPLLESPKSIYRADIQDGTPGFTFERISNPKKYTLTDHEIGCLTFYNRKMSIEDLLASIIGRS